MPAGRREARPLGSNGAVGAQPRSGLRPDGRRACRHSFRRPDDLLRAQGFRRAGRVALDAGGRALRNEAVFRRRFDGGLRSHGVL